MARRNSRTRPDPPLAVVERFAENTSSELVRMEQSPTAIVARFRQLRRSRPDLTAEDFLGKTAVQRFASADPVATGGRLDRPRLIALLKLRMPSIATNTLKGLSDDQLRELLLNLPRPM